MPAATPPTTATFTGSTATPPTTATLTGSNPEPRGMVGELPEAPLHVSPERLLQAGPTNSVQVGSVPYHILLERAGMYALPLE